MMTARFTQPGQNFRWQKSPQAFAPFQTTPMILTEGGQHGIAEGKLCPGNIAIKKIGIIG